MRIQNEMEDRKGWMNIKRSRQKIQKKSEMRPILISIEKLFHNQKQKKPPTRIDIKFFFHFFLSFPSTHTSFRVLSLHLPSFLPSTSLFLVSLSLPFSTCASFFYLHFCFIVFVFLTFETYTYPCYLILSFIGINPQITIWPKIIDRN